MDFDGGDVYALTRFPIEERFGLISLNCVGPPYQFRRTSPKDKGVVPHASSYDFSQLPTVRSARLETQMRDALAKG